MVNNQFIKNKTNCTLPLTALTNSNLRSLIKSTIYCKSFSLRINGFKTEQSANNTLNTHLFQGANDSRLNSHLTIKYFCTYRVTDTINLSLISFSKGGATFCLYRKAAQVLKYQPYKQSHPKGPVQSYIIASHCLNFFF